MNQVEGAFLRTLIVDDSPVIRSLLQRLLTSYGRCESVSDGQRAIDTFCRYLSEGDPFSLVCLDLGLNGITGADVLEKIRTAEKENGSAVKCRVLVITASSALTDVEAVRRHGADGYMVKPINKEKLAEYMTTFGFQCTPAAGEPVESQIQRIEEMCGRDAIPVAVMARLIQRMAGSIGRQLSATAAQSAAPMAKDNQ